VAKGGLGTLHESLAKVGDTKGCPIWIGNLEVDDRVAAEKIA
jgi:hypothetical protein